MRRANNALALSCRLWNRKNSLIWQKLCVAASLRWREDTALVVTMLMTWRRSIRGEVENAKRAVGLAVKIARNLAIDKLRRGTKKASGEIFLADSPYRQPDYIFEDNENSEWLKTRLQKLPTKEYAVLHLRQVERKTTDEIAAIVGISPVSVPTLLARARKKLLDDIKKRAL